MRPATTWARALRAQVARHLRPPTPQAHLLLVTADDDLLALTPWIEAPVIRCDDLASAVHRAGAMTPDGYVLAVGPDITNAYRDPLGAPPPIPVVVLHTDPARVDWRGVLELGAEHVWELPAELDWLTAALTPGGRQ